MKRGFIHNNTVIEYIHARGKKVATIHARMKIECSSREKTNYRSIKSCNERRTDIIEYYRLNHPVVGVKLQLMQCVCKSAFSLSNKTIEAFYDR